MSRVACDLSCVDEAAWEALAAAATHPQAAFRYLNLCTVDAGIRPQARMVVLRVVDQKRRMLEIHTDIRSPKWQELLVNPQAALLGFCPLTRIQLRLQGSVKLHWPESDHANAAWETLSVWTRRTYNGGPPGDQLAFGTGSPPITALTGGLGADGKSHFGVIVFQAHILDWSELRQQDNRRAHFSYDESGSVAQCQWTNP